MRDQRVLVRVGGELFEQIGLGQWFRVATGVVEVTGAVALLVPGLASIGALWLGGIIFF